MAEEEGKSKDLEMTPPDRTVSSDVSMSRIYHQESKISRSNSKATKSISWKNVHFKAGEKTTLDNCWGNVPAGNVCAIMGPSGSGKSSLLNVLAGRSSTSSKVTVSGNVKVGSNEINPVSFRKNIAYVMQDDSLLQTATPREALSFSANLRLPSDVTKEQIDALVEKTLKELGILECADVMIGGPLIKGISGGQRKRTSVGVEIITDPVLLFLDEPTSGLDSYTSFNLVKLLNEIAATGTAILCTIHQPSSEVFFLFNQVIFMKDGRIFYQGPVDGIVDFYSSRNHPCPTNYNPADFVMNLCQSDTTESLESKGLFVPAPEHGLSEQEPSMKEEEMVFHTESSLGKQLYYLSGRAITDARRDTGALGVRFGSTIILNLLFGLIFLQAGNKDNGNDEKFAGHVGALTMIIISSMFGSAQPALLNFAFQRPLFLRENSTGTYSTLAYFLSVNVVEVPLCFMQTLAQFVVAYFLINFQGNFMFLVLPSFGLALVSNSLAVFLGSAVADVKDALELGTLVFVPQILFGGFFIRFQRIPVFLRWARYLCGMNYGLNLAMYAEFNPGLKSCQTSEAARDNCVSLLDDNEISAETYWSSIILLFALFLVFRVSAGMLLSQKAKRFY